VYYRHQTAVPMVETIVCDDAGQFKLLTAKLALCWIHAGRHYEKLSPVVPHHAKLLDAFLDRYWDFYRSLQRYRAGPSDEQALRMNSQRTELMRLSEDAIGRGESPPKNSGNSCATMAASAGGRTGGQHDHHYGCLVRCWRPICPSGDSLVILDRAEVVMYGDGIGYTNAELLALNPRGIRQSTWHTTSGEVCFYEESRRRSA
jgi:hypothetical protein